MIFTADDFGLDSRVNDAVEQATRHGVLSAASLMVAAPAAEDAVRRARALADLHVGLHLVLTDGRPILPPDHIPDLVDGHGRFDDRMVRSGLRFAFKRAAKNQLAAEIRAQFEAFRATGLTLDHVNAHKHFHLHPIIAGLIVDIGREFGLTAMRVPDEPRLAGVGALGYAARLEATSVDLACRALRRRLRTAGIFCNDHIFGLRYTGHMTETRLLSAIEALPAGVTEIYLHPATQGPLTDAMADYDHAGELAALISPRVAAALAYHQIEPTGFSKLAAADRPTSIPAR